MVLVVDRKGAKVAGDKPRRVMEIGGVLRAIV